MMLFLALAAATMQEEDAAHRADRLEVQRLNSRSPNGYARRRRAATPSDGDADYAQAQADYRARLLAWRRRVAACEAGQYEACQ